MFIFRHVLRVGDRGIQAGPCARFFPAAPSVGPQFPSSGPAGERSAWHGKRPAVLPLALLFTVAPFSTTEGGLAAEAAELEPVVVVSTRSPRPVSEVVGMVTVLDQGDLQDQLASNEEGAWRYTPAIQVESAGSRFSARSISIRGIGGNRVLMEQDGIPIQERLVIGQVAYAGRSGAELDFVRRIEVLRGPASSLYGSKAIGGVVAVSTFDPDDFASHGSPGGRL